MDFPKHYRALHTDHAKLVTLISLLTDQKSNYTFSASAALSHYQNNAAFTTRTGSTNLMLVYLSQNVLAVPTTRRRSVNKNQPHFQFVIATATPYTDVSANNKVILNRECTGVARTGSKIIVGSCEFYRL